MRFSKGPKSAIAGFVAFWVGVGWAALHEHLNKCTYPPGWIIDHELYQPAAILAKAGILVFLVAGIGSMIFWASRVIAKRIIRGTHN